MSELATVYQFPRRYDRPLNKRQAAHELNVSVRTLDRMVSDGEIASHKTRGQRFFCWTEVERVKREGTHAQ